MHIYDWLELEHETEEERKVAEFLDWKTRAAYETNELKPKYLGLKVYCQYDGKLCRITGASRMGDVWLRFNILELEDNLDPSGYTARVMIEECSNFSYTDNRTPN